MIDSVTKLITQSDSVPESVQKVLNADCTIADFDLFELGYTSQLTEEQIQEIETKYHIQTGFCSKRYSHIRYEICYGKLKDCLHFLLPILKKSYSRENIMTSLTRQLPCDLISSHILFNNKQNQFTTQDFVDFVKYMDNIYQGFEQGILYYISPYSQEYAKATKQFRLVTPTFKERL